MSGYADKLVRNGVPIASNRGFSLTELIVVMAIFLSVMLITSSAFKLIANSTSQQSKSLETQIGGIVGLEVLRADLEQTGFGLPWTFQNTPLSGYDEAAVNTYDDAPASAPRPIVSGSNSAFGVYTGSKYIVIKSSVAASNETAKKWTNVSVANGEKTKKVWLDSHRDLAANDKVIVVKNNLMTTPATRQLMVSTTGTYFTTFGNYSTLTQPHNDGDTFQVYGIAPATVSSLRMPFNRADYYLRIPMNGSERDMPASCAPNTGVLFKATINHSDGARNEMPLLDCVADLQIVYGLSAVDSSVINLHLNQLDTMNAAEIRSRLKEIRVYILAQDGKKDRTYSYPSPAVDVGESLNGVFYGRRFGLNDVIGSDYKNYRWKVYTIVVRPKNLIQ